MAVAGRIEEAMAEGVVLIIVVAIAEVMVSGRNNRIVTILKTTLTRQSALQPISTETMRSLERAGSRGNSTILRPRGVNVPVLSKAPKIQS